MLNLSLAWTRTLSLVLLAALTGLAACADGSPASSGAPTETASGTADDFPADDLAQIDMGESVPDGDALTPDELIAKADDYAGKTVVVEGDASEVCQMEGCWLTMADDQGRTVRINVPRDDTGSYLFTFPKDVSGRTVRVAGQLAVETESVEDQRHYAQDGGATADEIEAITEPRQTLVFTAMGAEVVSQAQGA